jgi:hypothetical protein
VITKPAGSGGTVDRRSVIEQLVYEIGDPAQYYTPDVVADFTSVEVQETGPNEVLVSRAKGRPAPESLKVSMAYHAGYTASAQLVVWGTRAVERAQAAAGLVLKRLARAGYVLEHSNIELLGVGDSVPLGHRIKQHGAKGPVAAELTELVVRITARDPRRQAIERFTREIAPLITSGPSGLAGYATGRPAVRPVLAYWPTLIPRSLIVPVVDVRPARDWCRSDRA